jgi:hypothetical protein
MSATYSRHADNLAVRFHYRPPPPQRSWNTSLVQETLDPPLTTVADADSIAAAPRSDLENYVSANDQRVT